MLNMVGENKMTFSLYNVDIYGENMVYSIYMLQYDGIW